MRCRHLRLPLLLLALAAPAPAQTVNAARLAILQAEDRRAPTAADLATIRAGVRSTDPMTARTAVRALGHLERPELVPDILPGLSNRFSEVRTAAADAVAQAASGVSQAGNAGVRVPPAALLVTLAARLDEEEEPDVRAALAESIGRLPYTDADSMAAAQRALVDLAGRSAGVVDRLSVAKGFEAFVRMHKGTALTDASAQVLRTLATVPAVDAADGGRGAEPRQAAPDPLKDARVRRLALQALASADRADKEVVSRGVADPDPQVRLLAVRAAGKSASGVMQVMGGLKDREAMVRFEAVRALPAAAGEEACALTLGAVSDENPHVALQAIDQLSACGGLDQVVERLAALAADTAAAERPRGWHRAAHALVALAGASPERARPLVRAFLGSSVASLRLYAARASSRLGDRAALETLAADPDDNVAEAAIEGLAGAGFTDAIDVYLAGLGRPAYQVIRAAARALEQVPEAARSPRSVATLQSAFDRLVSEGHDNSTDIRTAIATTLTKWGSPPPRRPGAAPRRVDSALNLADLKRLAAPRARVTIRGVGVFDLALITFEAPATVLGFARLSERGYYDGLTFHRVAPNFVIQGGSPDANEYVGAPDHMRDEVGLWPHVRGAVGISTRGRDTGDAQIFIDLVDSPLLDHRFTVFAQVLNGMAVVDQILEGDVIDSIRILDER
jgi:cyclophilin family peptidyl-prolyl cis-trans isomerase/HEAT repeat protein